MRTEPFIAHFVTLDDFNENAHSIYRTKLYLYLNCRYIKPFTGAT
jgi:hypothetical protein